MTQVLTTTNPADTDIAERVMIMGDLSQLSAAERVRYYSAVCRSLGLNPLTKPFDYISLSGKLVLYAKKDATEQLRKINAISITSLERDVTEGVYVVTAHARTPDGRTDSSIGAVFIEGLKGEARANAMMKAETKAKRRVTLSISGLGMLDETEIETIPNTQHLTERDEPPVVVVTKAQPQAQPAPAAQSWKDEIKALGQRAGKLMTQTTPIELATTLSAAISAGRAVYAKNGKATEEEIAEAKKQLQAAIAEAEAQA